MTPSVNLSKISLIVANLIPLVGVLIWSYDLKSIMFIYWMESLVIVLFNYFKIKKAKGGISSEQMLNGNVSSVMLARYLVDHSNPKSISTLFILKYGFLFICYGLFIINVFGMPEISGNVILINIAILFLSHFISYKVNFIGKEEFLKVSPSYLVSQPQGRLLVMHVTIIAMGFFLVELGQPIYALVIMIILKIIVDLISHSYEHKKIESMVKINS